MPNRILLCGLNGSGKSTLGKALADALGWQFLDIEDYWFPEKNASYAYETVRTGEEVNRLLYADLLRYPHCILASVKGNVGEENIRLLSGAVWLRAPREIRMQRVYDRSYRKFGDRILPGGDLYEKEKQFFDMVQGREEAEVENWLCTLSVPVIQLDGTLPIHKNVETLCRRLV